MCHDRNHPKERRRDDCCDPRPGPDFRPGYERYEAHPPKDRRFDDGCCDDYEDDSDDPIEGLKSLMNEVTEEAFLEILREKTKLKLEAQMGERIDAIAEAFVKYYVKAREAEVAEILDEEALDEELKESLKK